MNSCGGGLRCTVVGGLQIIQVNLTSENPQPIVPGMNVEFTYSVRWAPSAIPFPRRFERYLDYNFFEHQVRQDLVVSFFL